MLFLRCIFAERPLSVVPCSTNDIDHPLVWGTLPLDVKQRLFFTTSNSCCSGHFRETENCKVIDKCREVESHASAVSVPRLRSVVKRQLTFDSGNNPAMNIKMLNSQSASQAQSLRELPSNCGLWHPSVTERGTWSVFTKNSLYSLVYWQTLTSFSMILAFYTVQIAMLLTEYGQKPCSRKHILNAVFIFSVSLNAP